MPAESVIYTKSGAPVMCLHNENRALHNGTICTFIAKIDHDTVEIDVQGSQYNLKKSCMEFFEFEESISTGDP